MEKRWFKRKKYGWGWTPATREGWIVTLLYIAAALYFAFSAEGKVTSESIFRELYLPLIALTILFLIIAHKTGEKPRWQWGKWNGFRKKDKKMY